MSRSEAEERAAVVAEARLWLGTPYAHRQRLRGLGVDCAQLPAAVYHAAGLIPAIKPDYVQDWHLHRDEERFIGWVLKMGAVEIERDQIGPGDLGLWRWGRAFSHGGIVVDPPFVIHSYVEVGVTLDDITSHEELKTRPARFFSFWKPGGGDHGRRQEQLDERD